MHAPIDKITRTKILEEVKNGSKVPEVAIKYNVSDKTIYNWMRQQAYNTGTSSLEIAKLKKENQELKELIGLFTLQKKRAEKNTRRS